MPNNRNFFPGFGLVLAQQILAVDDLHFGLGTRVWSWLPRTWPARQHYTDMLLQQIGALLADCPCPRILDVGCGTGHLLQLMIERGYAVNCVNSSAELNRQVRTHGPWNIPTARCLNPTSSPCPCRPAGTAMTCCYSARASSKHPVARICKEPQLLKPAGQLLICDFFKTAAHCDGAAGDRSFSGGHLLGPFYDYVSSSPFSLRHDEDLTPRISPNIALLRRRHATAVAPASRSIDRYLRGSYPWSTRLSSGWHDTS